MNKWMLSAFLLIILNFYLLAQYSDGSWDYKLPDEIGNLFKTKEKTDRQYGKAGQLLKDETYSYTYDEVGNLIEKESITDRWRYKWSQSGMLKKVRFANVYLKYVAITNFVQKRFREQLLNSAKCPIFGVKNVFKIVDVICSKSAFSNIPLSPFD